MDRYRRRIAMLSVGAQLGCPVRRRIEGEIEIARPVEIVFETTRSHTATRFFFSRVLQPFRVNLLGKTVYQDMRRMEEVFRKDGISRIISRDKIQRRWVEISFITFRLAGFAALVFLVLPPGKAVAFLGVQLAVFGLYMGSSFAPNHIGMPLVSARLKLDFLRRQVLMSRNISGGSPISVFIGGLNYQIEHHLFPSMARPYLRKAQPLVAAYCAAQGVPYTRTTLWQSYRIVIGYLNSVGLRGKDPFLCPLVAQRRAL
jgi:hypothetical protein